MMPLINLLPWRPLRRRHRLKIWGCILLFGVLLITGSMLLWTHSLAVKVRWQQAKATQLEVQESALKALLSRQQKELKERQQRLAILQAEVTRKDNISRWENVLNMLASRLPENSWLQRVSWQNESATISGVAGDARELDRFEAVLADLPGAFKVKSGELRDEKGKGLVFTFTLTPMGGEHAE
ncbi:PilN domain-containing protein [Cedecea sp. NFIX57]|uniref:PilN domain-containing protein n=1 Tax=Cedecea sp. NFIX57 TaxID=1566286 RepID=UPI000A0A5FC7|nr:PilN domain-containing protein [Cedecea sp. NFIX57]SMG15839.1 pilus assembly protein HofN [Cedecea sp. NFIX57]